MQVESEPAIKEFIQPLWEAKNEVLNTIDFTRVWYVLDGYNGRIQLAEQDIAPLGKSGSAEDRSDAAFMGSKRRNGCVGIDMDNVTKRGVVAMSYQQALECFKMSVKDKVTLAEASFRIVGESDYRQSVIDWYRGPESPKVYAWFPGCEKPQPTTTNPAMQAPRKAPARSPIAPENTI